MQTDGRWLVCSGPREFVPIAAALAASDSARSVVWEPTATRGYLRAAELRAEGEVNVIVGDGVQGDAAPEVACALAALGGGAVVLCGARASDTLASSLLPRGVTAVIEPAMLARFLTQGGFKAVPVDAAGGKAVESSPATASRPVTAHHMELQGVGLDPACGIDTDTAATISVRDNDAVAAAVEGPVGCDVHFDSLEPNDVPAMRTTGRFPKVGVSEAVEQVMHPGNDIAAIPIEIEPVVRVPVIELPQIDDMPAGIDDHIPTVCFTSARGGVGKSSLAVMGALALAHSGLSVALIDLDFQFGTSLGYLGAEETDGLFDVGVMPEHVRIDARAMARCRTTPESNLAAFEFCKAPEQAEVLGRMAGGLLRAARAGADIVVVDMPTGVGEGVARVFELADRCLLVTDQRAFSLESLTAQQSLCARLGVARTKLVTVVNRCDPRHRDEGYLERLRFSLQTPQMLKVVDGGAEVGQMLAIGSARELMNVRNRFALSASDMMLSLAADLGCRAFATGPTPGSSGLAQGRRGFLHKGRKQQRREVGLECPF